jgi:hypothetical protein
MLRKGFLPEGRPLTPAELEKIRNVRFNPTTERDEPREVPLTEDELECWQYQSKYVESSSFHLEL